jgi:hypothetical protein
MIDRRLSPRIKFAKKSEFTVFLILKRFILMDREIECILRDLSEGGASVMVKDEFRKYISESNRGQTAHLVSNNPGLSFHLKKKGRILRIIEEKGRVSLILAFATGGQNR